MNELFPTIPSRPQLLTEFQLEDSLLEIDDAYKACMFRRIENMRTLVSSAEDDNSRRWIEREITRVELSINHGAPLSPAIYQYGKSLNLCLRRENIESGLALIGSTIIVAKSEVDKGEYFPEPDFTNEQVNALLGQQTRYMILGSSV